MCGIVAILHPLPRIRDKPLTISPHQLSTSATSHPKSIVRQLSQRHSQAVLLSEQHT